MDYPATTIEELIAIGRQQRADALAAEQAQRKAAALQAAQARQASLETFRSLILSELPAVLHQYIDYENFCIDDWHDSTNVAIRIPECAEIRARFDRRSGQLQWDGHYRISAPDHVEYDYQDGYAIHYEPRSETELPLALAAAADAHPRLLELQAEIKALEESRRISQQQTETCAAGREKEDERQHEALLRILNADPVLRAIFHAAIAYQNARGSWDAQLSSQYQSMQALECRYSDDLDLERARRDYDAEQRALGASPEASTPPEPAPLPPPHSKPGPSPDDVARIRDQLARRRGGS